MTIRTSLAAAALVGLAAMPAAASAAPATAPIQGENELGGGDGVLFAVLAAAIIAAYVFFTIEADDEDGAVSP